MFHRQQTHGPDWGSYWKINRLHGCELLLFSQDRSKNLATVNVYNVFGGLLNSLEGASLNVQNCQGCLHSPTRYDAWIVLCTETSRGRQHNHYIYYIHKWDKQTIAESCCDRVIELCSSKIFNSSLGETLAKRRNCSGSCALVEIYKETWHASHWASSFSALTTVDIPDA